MTVIFDAGAFVALERGDRDLVAIIKRERLAGRAPITHGGAVGQVWRGGQRRQALLARALAGVEVVPLDDMLGRRAGALLGATRMNDVVDAALVLLAGDGDEVYTSDPHDLAALAHGAQLHVDVIVV